MDKKSATILVVDDENTQLTEKLLASEGYHILTAKNGLAGLKVLQEEDVDLVLLDIVMPEMDGYEMLRQIRSQYEDQVSVLLASASYIDSVHVAHGLQIGADDYIIKPFDFFELKARIESKLHQHDLKNELREARCEAEAQSELLRGVLTIVQNATSNLERDSDKQTVAQTIYKGLEDQLSIHEATIWRFNGEKIMALRDNPQPLPEDMTMMIQGNQTMRREGSRLLLPMRIKDKVEGLLDIEWVESGPKEGITILKALADSLAIVFQNSDYVQQIKRERLFHELLNRLASEDAPLEKMLEELGQFTATRLLLVNRWFDLLIDEEVAQFVQDGRIRPFIIDYYRVQGVIEQIEYKTSIVAITNYGVIPAHHLIPVRLGGEVMALIISLPLPGANQQRISEKELEGVARFLAGVLQRRREVDLREQRYQADFLNEFLSGRLAKMPRSDVFLRANAQGLNLALPGLVARIELSNFDQKVDWSKPLFLEYVREQLTPLWRDAKAARLGLKLEGLEVIIGKNVVSILSLPLASTEKQARQKGYHWAEQVLNSYAHRNKQSTNKPVIGLGRLVTHWQKWPRSANEAERALRWVLSNAQVSISYYGDLGSERLLAAVNDREELRRFHEEQLGPLIAYDNEREGELRHTLETFFANGGQLSRTAQKLYIHSNTLKYRLDQIATLTGRDPRHPNVALDFQLALKIHNMF
jgi:DNA-binding response OmpR family regulator/sugar diacid utilization regulator